MDADSHLSRVSALRKNYMQRGLTKAELDPSPFVQFDVWFNEAVDSKLVAEPNAMVLSTVSQKGQPSSRYVLLKSFGSDGFGFFTNLFSNKAHDLADNPRAALNFGWIELERQVCIQGQVRQKPRSDVEAYFQTRPRGSRLGAWASSQSKKVPGRATLNEQLAQTESRFPDDVPTPPDWGGFVLEPQSIEFWQGRTNRLHDRLRYDRNGDSWIISRLSP